MPPEQASTGGLNYRQTRFILGADSLTACPPDDGGEVAFCGRSNAGKSSAINALCDQRKLARASQTPGRTQLLNYFQVAEKKYLVDLPGFGYARAAKRKTGQWQRLMQAYLEKRRSLRGLVLLADCRRPLKEIERGLISWCNDQNLPILVLLTKSDKLNARERRLALKRTRQWPGGFSEQVNARLFSAVSKDGLAELRTMLDQWLEG